MSCRLETEEGKFNVTIEREQGRSFLVTRRMGPAGEALISALTPEQVVRMVLNRRIVQVGKTMTVHVIAAALPITNEPISLSPMKGVAT